jgi:penicillin amidase
MKWLPLILLTSGCALFKLAAVQKSHPPLDGRISVEGLHGEVRVARDDLGVPHVRATDEHDAWFTLGLLHAHDRLWQADVARHVAFGRLSELLGPGTVEIDVFARQMDLRTVAEANLARQDPAIRSHISAYTDGINAGIGTLRAPPIEHRLLGVEPRLWDAADVWAIGFLQSWNLQGNLGEEVGAWAMRDEWDAETFDALFGLDDTLVPIEERWDSLRTEAQTGRLTAQFQGWASAFGGDPSRPEASNNWVVGGSRTASGMPILANDPHLAQSVPSLWYIADVKGGDLHVAGATLPGMFGVTIGHNETVAWGLTNLMADYIDIAVLERVGEEAVRIGDETVPLVRATVEVSVKDEEPVRRTVYRTPVGPLISELEGTHVLAMRWHALELEDAYPEVVHALAHSTTAGEAAALASAPLLVAQGVALADTEGDWGTQYIGSVPVRTAHSGRVPYDASESGWDGWFARLPGEHAPERGWVRTANARPEFEHSWWADEEPIAVDAITSSWVPKHRHRRIAELLDAAEAVTPDDVAAMQRDVLDIAARETLPALLEGVTPSPLGQPCFDALTTWDFQMAGDSAGAAVWTRFQTALIDAALSDDLSPEALRTYRNIASPGRNLMTADRLGPWMDDRLATVTTALDVTCRRMSAAQGPVPSEWRWADVHPLTLEHPFAGGRAMLSAWNMPSVGFPGNGATVAAASHGWDGDTRGVTGMASLRLVVPMDDPGAATLVHPGGQSGQPRSDLYRSHFDAFVAGETTPLWFDDDDVVAHTAWELILTP